MITKADLKKYFDVAVQAAHPSHCLSRYLPELPNTGRVIVLGAGKACSAMVQALEQHYSEQGNISDIEGTAVTRHGYKLPTEYIPILEAGHPVPDEYSEQAALEALRVAEGAGENDLVLVLLSGGASALWSAPQEGLSLASKQSLTKQLLRSGAAIDEINCVRKHLSKIKGGRLAKAAYPAKLLTLSISDVPNDDISSIGSGPTVGDPTSCEDAIGIIEKYGIEIGGDIRDRLISGEMESLFPGDPCFDKSEYHLIATPAMALEATAEVLRQDGYETIILGDSVEGEAREVALAHAQLALELSEQGRKAALLSGGELTVTIKGNGSGGPNQEYALALSKALDGAAGISGFAGDTDGVDGGGGESDDPAGAYVFPDTLARAAELNLNVNLSLDNNDSSGFFGQLGDLEVCGATQTNVNDFRLILVDH